MPEDQILVLRKDAGTDSLRRWKRALIALGVAILLVQWVRLGIKPRGDFDLHWELGRRLWAGEFIYERVEGGDERGHDYPYPPFWGLAHAPLTVMQPHAAQMFFFPVFALSLALVIWSLNRMTESTTPVQREWQFWIAAAAILLSSRYLVRDMMECGINLALVAFSYLAVWLWSQRKEWLAGGVLGFAIALKCTPALFLAWFAWKRQWKMLATSLVATAAFTLSPILVMGPTQYSHAVQFWIAHAWEGFGQPNPSIGVLGEEPLQNNSLRPSLARYLMHLPEDHQARLDHPLYFDVFDFSPTTAGVVIKVIMLALLVGVAWCFRSPVRNRHDSQIAWECAAVSLMILLFSPITWGQHCVGVLPLFYLTVRSVVCHGMRNRYQWCLVGMYVIFVLVMNRSVVGKEVSYLIDAYHIHTVLFLALLVVAIHGRIRATHQSDHELPRPSVNVEENQTTDSYPRRAAA